MEIETCFVTCCNSCHGYRRYSSRHYIIRVVTIEDTRYDLGEELSAFLEEAHYDRTTDVFKLEDGDGIEVSQSVLMDMTHYSLSGSLGCRSFACKPEGLKILEIHFSQL